MSVLFRVDVLIDADVAAMRVIFDLVVLIIIYTTMHSRYLTPIYSLALTVVDMLLINFHPVFELNFN